MNIRLSCVALLVVVTLLIGACASDDHEHGHGHDHGHGHGDHETPDFPTGPNGGRLIEQAGITFEIKIIEDTTPRFRLWLTQDGEAVDPSAVRLRVETTRLLGQTEQFDFRPDQDSWVATRPVGEPHSFDVRIDAEVSGERVTATYESYEGRTIIEANAVQEAGVVTAQVGGGTIVTTTTAKGIFRAEPDAEAVATARFPGVVKSIRVRVGDRIRRGDTVAVIDGDLSLAPYSIVAPLSGVVVERLQEVGAHVDGDPIVRIIDPEKLIAELVVFGSDVSRVSRAQRVHISRPGDTRQIEGRILRITPNLRASTQSVTAQVELIGAAPQWPPGTAVTGQIVLEDTMVKVRVPQSALQTFRTWEVVFIKQGDIYEVQPVTIGRRDAQFAEVVSGLLGGETIVTEQSFLIKADIEKSGAVHDH